MDIYKCWSQLKLVWNIILVNKNDRSKNIITLFQERVPEASHNLWKILGDKAQAHTYSDQPKQEDRKWVKFKEYIILDVVCDSSIIVRRWCDD